MGHSKQPLLVGVLGALSFCVVCNGCSPPQPIPAKTAEALVANPAPVLRIPASLNTVKTTGVSGWRLYVGYTQVTMLGLAKNGTALSGVRIRPAEDGQSIDFEMLTKRQGILTVASKGTALKNTTNATDRTLLGAAMKDLKSYNDAQGAANAPYDNAPCSGSEWGWATGNCTAGALGCMTAETGLGLGLCAYGGASCVRDMNSCLTRDPPPEPDVKKDSCEGVSPPKKCAEWGYPTKADREKAANSTASTGSTPGDPNANSSMGAAAGDPAAASDPSMGAAAGDPAAASDPSMGAAAGDPAAASDPSIGAAAGESLGMDAPDQPDAADPESFGGDAVSPDAQPADGDTVGSTSEALSVPQISCNGSRVLQCGVRTDRAFCRCLAPVSQ